MKKAKPKKQVISIIYYVICLLAGMIVGTESVKLFSPFKTAQQLNELAVQKAEQTYHTDTATVTKFRIMYLPVLPDSFFSHLFFDGITQEYVSVIRPDITENYKVISGETLSEENQNSYRLTKQLSEFLNKKFESGITGCALSRKNGKMVQYYIAAEKKSMIDDFSELIQGIDTFVIADEVILYYVLVPDIRLVSDNVELLKLFHPSYDILPAGINRQTKELKRYNKTEDFSVVLKGEDK